MSFLVVVAVFLIVQYWGSGEPIQKDHWWQGLARFANAKKVGVEATLVMQVLLPVIVAWCVFNWVSGFSTLLLFSMSILGLLFCLGRGDFSEWVKGYVDAFHRNDNEVAAEYAQRLGVNTDVLDGWNDLHHQVLRRVAYRAFERMFVVVFWFVLLGVAGALLYRLADFAQRKGDNSDECKALSARLMWMLEWPAVRVLGASMALTGNFMGAFQALGDSLFSLNTSTEDELERMVHGALNVNSSALTQDGVTESEIEALQPLLSRSLILWLCALALLSLF